MSTATIDIIHNGEPMATVAAEEIAPGLYIYLRPNTESWQWRIAHQTGLVIGKACCREAAVDGARAIAGLTDWTLTPEELTGTADGPASVDANEVDALLAENCCLIAARPA